MKLKNLFIALLLIVPIWCLAENPPTFTVPLKKGQQPPGMKNPGNLGGRQPVKTIMCFISAHDGVQIEGVAIGQIYSYEIYSEEECCLVSCSSAVDFVNFLMHLTEGGYVIQFQTEEYIYRGYISIE